MKMSFYKKWTEFFMSIYFYDFLSAQNKFLMENCFIFYTPYSEICVSDSKRCAFMILFGFLPLVCTFLHFFYIFVVFQKCLQNVQTKNVKQR